MSRDSDISRRRFMKTALGLGALAVFVPGAVGEFETGRGSRVRWGRLRFQINSYGTPRYRDWNAHPAGDLALVQRIRDATNVNMAFDFGAPHVEDLEHMAQYPFIFMHEQRAPALTDKHRENIREYLHRGGFMFIDDCVLSAAQPDIFYTAMRREMARILPDARYVELSKDKNHEIFRCVYAFPEGFAYAHPLGVNHGLWGIYEKERLVALMCSSDLHCAWAQVIDGLRDTEPFLRMGVNIYVYAMTH